MSRLAVLDGMRGYFLVFMLLNHLSFTGGLWLVHINHAELGFVQDAQGFIFLSACWWACSMAAVLPAVMRQR